MAQAVAARGPLTFLLQSSSGQYLALGLGVYALFPEKVQQALAPLLGDGYLQFLSSQQQQHGQQQHGQQQPIIIQTPPTTIYQNSSGGQSSSKSLTQVLIYSMAGAGACWVGYIVCSQLLPDAVSEFMPVTKRLFKSTSEALGASILQVKQVLQDQLDLLLSQQDALQATQDETNRKVDGVKGELGNARQDLGRLQSSMDSVELGMEQSKELQGYTLKGIQLLVRCVTSFLPEESQYIHDISQYIESSQGDQGKVVVKKTTSTTTKPTLTMSSASASQQQQRPQGPVDSLPNISSIESSEDGFETDGDDDDEVIPGGNYMGDIRALLGH